MEKKINIAWAGWGTGGHVFPIKSLIQYLDSTDKKKNVWKMFWFWKKNSLEEENYKSLKKWIDNLYFVPIFSGKRRRDKSFQSFIKNLWDLFLFWVGILQSMYYLLKYKINVVFCKWWYVALPVVVAAKILKKRIVVHESDVHPWLVNNIASKFAYKVFTWFDNVFKNAETIGQILSEDLLPKGEKNLSKKTTVLVMWGSQGSKNLYESLIKLLRDTPDLQDFDFKIVLWKLNQELREQFSSFKNVECFDFLSQKEIGANYYLCDIAITRAGTTSLAEQELFDLKLIMVPIPRTHDQLDNAKRYVEHKNGILVQQDDVKFMVKLKESILSLKGFKKKLNERDRKKEIATAKNKILESILE